MHIVSFWLSGSVAHTNFFCSSIFKQYIFLLSIIDAVRQLPLAFINSSSFFLIPCSFVVGAGVTIVVGAGVTIVVGAGVLAGAGLVSVVGAGVNIVVGAGVGIVVGVVVGAGVSLLTGIGFIVVGTGVAFVVGAAVGWIVLGCWWKKWLVGAGVDDDLEGLVGVFEAGFFGVFGAGVIGAGVIGFPPGLCLEGFCDCGVGFGLGVEDLELGIEVGETVDVAVVGALVLGWTV